MDSLFFFPFLFFLTMAPQVLEKKIALLFTYRKIVIIFKSVELELTPSSFPQSKRWSATMAISKKKKGSSRRIYSCFFTHNGITTPKTTREGQESTTKTSLHLAWPPKFKNQVLFTPRVQSRFLDLGLLLRGCRPKSRSLSCRVEVIHPVVRACTTFWLTSTRITLTRVHRPAATCVGMLRYSMTTTRKVKDLCSPRGARKKVFLGTSSTVTLLEKKSRQECRTVLKLCRNIFGLSTHHSNVKKRIKSKNKKIPLQTLLLLFSSIFDLKRPTTTRFSISQKMWMLVYILSCVEKHLR